MQATEAHAGIRVCLFTNDNHLHFLCHRHHTTSSALNGWLVPAWLQPRAFRWFGKRPPTRSNLSPLKKTRLGFGPCADLKGARQLRIDRDSTSAVRNALAVCFPGWITPWRFIVQSTTTALDETMKFLYKQKSDSSGWDKLTVFF